LFVRLIERESWDAIAKGWGTVMPREQRPGPESKGRIQPRGEKRLGSEEQSEDQECHGSRSYVGVE
jgi:hypothetical protein